MEILLISESNAVYCQTRRVIDKQIMLHMISFDKIKDIEQLSYDILIIDFNRSKVADKKFKTILDVRCKSKVPILALLEDSRILDQFEVLAMGALDFLELPATDELYIYKLKQLYKWKWYYDWEKRNPLN